jgi:hypothetical protein
MSNHRLITFLELKHMDYNKPFFAQRHYALRINEVGCTMKRRGDLVVKVFLLYISIL